MRGRYFVGELCDSTQRGFDTAGDLDAHAERARRIGEPILRHRIVLAGDFHGEDMPRQPGEIGEERAGVLAAHHARDHHQRPRHPLLEIAERGRRDAAAFGVMAAVEPDLAALRPQFDQLARRQPLHPRRPFGVDDALIGRMSELERVDRAHGRDRQPGIVELMPAEQLWRRQVHQAALVLIDQPAALDTRHAIAARQHAAARASARVCCSITSMASGCCSAEITGTLRLMIAAFSPAMRRQRIA